MAARQSAAGSPTTTTPTGLALGFAAGVRAFFGGAGFVVRTPTTWGYAAIPAAMAAALFVVLGALTLLGTGALAARILDGATEGALATAGHWLLRIALGAVGLLVSFVLSMSLAQPLSSFALEKIVKLQTRALGGPELRDPPALDGLLRSLRVSLAALAVALPILGGLALVTFLVPPAAIVTVPLKLVVAGLLVAYDLLDYPLSLRAVDVGARFAFIRRNAAAVLGLGLSASVLMLVPGLFLVLLPWGAAGAARLVHEAGTDRA